MLDIEFISIHSDETTAFAQVAYLIRKQHDWAINEVTICVNRYHPNEAVDHLSTFLDHGITCGLCDVYYDFEPYYHPLLM